MPEVAVQVTGRTPLDATVYQMQRLRCNLCGEIYKTEHGAQTGICL